MFNKGYFRPVSIIVIIAFLFFPNSIYALPEGEQVVSGQATFDRSQNDTLNINVSTNRLITNYDSFSIAQSEAVNFYQPSSSSVALNRVIGVDPSRLLGTLTANGKIYLVNPHGVLFGPGCRIDTAGMIASTLNITDSDFLAGRYTFYGQGGSVVNQGYISSPGGYIALLGSSVENIGIIEAELGTITLASGQAITLNLDPQGLISVVVDDATTQNLEEKGSAVDNTGTLSADGGKVILTAQALDGVFDRAINTTGIIEANSIDGQTGEVTLEANQRVNVSGEISAEGGSVTVDSQGADYSGKINADTGVFNAHDGDTFINQAKVTGADMTWLDNINIFLVGNTYVTGDVTIKADNDNDGMGDFTQAIGTRLIAGGDVNIEGANLYLLDIIFGGETYNYFDALAKTGEIKVGNYTYTDPVSGQPFNVGDGKIMSAIVTPTGYTEILADGVYGYSSYTDSKRQEADQTHENQNIKVDSNRWGWFRFDLGAAGVPSDTFIISADLWAWLLHHTGGNYAIGAFHGENDYSTGGGPWLPEGLTWNNQPASDPVTDPTSVVSFPNNKYIKNGWYTWGVTDGIQDDLGGNSTWVFKNY
ncbi:MAG: filamentous hemagglutinin N-terminal domain-containing protein, partial [Candidatus Omnitrophota bacterium]